MTNRKLNRKFRELSESSLNELIRETYGDIVDERTKAVDLYKKYMGEIYSETDENDEVSEVNRRNTIALVGRHLTDALKVLDSSIDNKIKLIKIYSTHLLKSGNKEAAEELENNGTGITTNDKESVHELIRKMQTEGGLADLGIKEYD